MNAKNGTNETVLALLSERPQTVNSLYKQAEAKGFVTTDEDRRRCIRTVLQRLKAKGLAVSPFVGQWTLTAEALAARKVA